MLAFLMLTLIQSLVLAQSIDIQKEIFPGIKKVIIKSTSKGYRGEYILDKCGRAETEERYKHTNHLATNKYWFTKRGKLVVHKVTYDINDPKRIQTFYNHYFYSADSSKILKDVCYTDADTLYTITYTAFNEDSQPVKYTKFTHARKVFASDVEVSYLDKRVINWKSTKREDGQITSCEYSYNDRGDIVSEKRSLTPAPTGENLWIDGQGDLLKWKYEYNKDSYWTRKFELVNDKYVLVETRKYIKGK
jgi:hypothetical protein